MQQLQQTTASMRTLEQQFSTLGPFAVAFVGSNSLLAGQVKA